MTWHSDAASGSCSDSSSLADRGLGDGPRRHGRRSSDAQPQVAGNSTLVLRIGGDLQETEPGGVIGQFFEAPATVRSLVEALRKAKVDRRISSVIVRPYRRGSALGQGPGGP